MLLLDEFDGAVSAGGDGLDAGAGEPVDHRAAGDHAEQERGVEQRKFVDVVREVIGQGDDGGEDHGRGADDGGADQHGFGGGLEGVARAIVFFEVILGLVELGLEAVLFSRCRRRRWEGFRWWRVRRRTGRCR